MSTNYPPPISQEGIPSVPQPQEPLGKPAPQQKQKAEKTNFISSKLLSFSSWVQGKIKAFLSSKKIIERSTGEIQSGPTLSKMIKTGKEKGTISRQQLLSSQPLYVSRNEKQLPRSETRKLFTSPPEIHKNWKNASVNLFDLQLENLDTKDPLNIARNALKEALKTNPSNPMIALSVFATNREWKRHLDKASIEKILSDARSNPDIFGILAQEIAFDKKTEAQAPRREQSRSPSPPPLGTGEK